jgi:hypothetical protein
VRCAGLQRTQVAPRQEMPNLENPWGVAVSVLFSVIFILWRWLFTLLGGG